MPHRREPVRTGQMTVSRGICHLLPVGRLPSRPPATRRRATRHRCPAASRCQPDPWCRGPTGQPSLRWCSRFLGSSGSAPCSASSSGTGRAKRSAASGGYEGGEGLATAGIVIGWVTLALFAVALAIWIWLFTVIHSDINTASSQQNQVDQCQSDVRVVDVAVTAYEAQKGSFPDPDSSVECRDLREQLWATDHRERRRSVSERGSVDRGLRRRVRLQRQRLGRPAQHLRTLFRRGPRPGSQPQRLRGRRRGLTMRGAGGGGTVVEQHRAHRTAGTPSRQPHW